MSSEENKIFFNEIKSYEDAYYYNSDPNDRVKYKKSEIKLEKKKFNFGKGFLEFIGEIIEVALEVLFSIID